MFKMPSTLVFPDPDVDAPRAGLDRLTGKSRELATSFVAQYDKKGDLTDKQWAVAQKLVAELATPVAPKAEAPAMHPDLELLKRHADKSFNPGAAADLVAKAARWTLSDAQMGFVAKLAESARRKLAPQAEIVQAPVVTGAAALVAMFDKVSQVKQWPEIETDLFRAYRSGPSSREPGSIVFTKPGKRGEYLGTLSRSGKLMLRDAGKAVQAAIEAFVADPVGQGAATSKRLGVCCFCSRTLETGESTAVGYGPVCATNWGLPWGHVKAPSREAFDLSGFIAEETGL